MKKANDSQSNRESTSRYFIKIVNIVSPYSERLTSNKIKIENEKIPLRLTIGKSKNSSVRYTETRDILDDHCEIELDENGLQVKVNQSEKTPIEMGTFILIRKFEDKEKLLNGSEFDSDETVTLTDGDYIYLLGLIFAVEIKRK
jgi:hypothetical protein